MGYPLRGGGQMSTSRYWLLFTSLVSVAELACGGPTAPPPSGNDQQTSSADAGADITSAAEPKCGPTPTQLVDFDVLASQTGTSWIGAMQLVVDSMNVYFVFGDQLMRVPIRGGDASGSKLSLDPNGFGNWDPVVTPTAIVLHYPTSDAGLDNEHIVSVPTQGGPETILATSHDRVWSLTADAHNAYFADSDGIQRVSLAGGDVQLLTVGVDGDAAEVGGLTVIGPNVIATSQAQGGTVLSVPIQGGAVTTLATQQAASFPMACNSDICWWTGGSETAMGMVTAPGYFARLTATGVTTVEGQVFPWSIAFDGSAFFETVGCDLCSGTLVRFPASGAPAVNMGSAGFVAVDDQCAYFSVLLGDSTLPSQSDGGLVTGIYSVQKSYMAP